MSAAGVSAGNEFSGVLKERVTLERQSAGRDMLGLPNGIWLSRGSVWAAIQVAGEGAAIVGDTASSLPRFHVVLRYRNDVAPGDRMIWRARALSVQSVTVDNTMPDRMICLTEEMR